MPPSPSHHHHHSPGRPSDVVDVVIVGGGAAGLSAALTLARVRRSVVVIDAGEPRNAPASHMHGFLTRDGTPPLELLELGRAEITAYGARVIEGRAVQASIGDDQTFVVELDDGRTVRGRRLLVTTGLVDELPPIDGLAARWGRDALHCPYCHGWEVRDQAIVVIATGATGVHQASLFRQMSPNVTLVVHAGHPPTTLERAQLASRNVAVVEEAVAEVVVADDRITGVRTASGQIVPADAVVVGPRLVARSGVLASLGLEPVEQPLGIGAAIEADAMGATAVPGVWVAGNVTDLKATVVQSAAAATMAAAAINADLVAADTKQAMAEAGEVTDLPVMDEAFWDERYRSKPKVWSGNPNPHLVSDTADLAPGRALDVGAGEGADAIWLAEQGWEVTAVDVSAVALERGRRQAAELGEETAGRITWVHADITAWEMPVGAFDLVSVQFVHLPSGDRFPLYQRCADAVAPGGHLLIGAHHPSDLETTAGRPRAHDMFFTADELARQLDDGWTVLASDARPRPATDPAGEPITIHDTVLYAVRS